MTLAQLLAARPHVLLDFDGPVCAVFGGELPAPAVAHRLADEGRRQGLHLPADVEASGDPFDVLHAAARLGEESARIVELALRRAEVRAVESAPMTPGLRAALDALCSSSHAVTIVSNNSAAAVQHFLEAHALTDVIPAIVARTDPDPTLLKPSAHLLALAIRQAARVPADCILIGDSTTDVIAARAAGTAVIAYANKPGKRDALQKTRPDAIINTLAEVTHAAAHPYVS
jgi:phosphoglycolate phosphatase-like HAD superfamily hydrolase